MATLANNKKALFNYELLKEFEAGIALEGWEVKSIKLGKVSIKESFIDITKREVWLVGSHISRFKNSDKSVIIHEYRKRKLLLHDEEIKKLEIGKNIKGNTIIPLKMIVVRNRIKVVLALARGLKRYDKREKLKEKDMKRQIERDLKEI